MARDESKRRYGFRLSQLDDSQIRKGGYDKINKEPTVMYRCPECGHRAFQLSPRSGWYNCWACGVWGQMKEGNGYGLAVSGSGLAVSGSSNTTHKTQNTTHSTQNISFPEFGCRK